MKRRARKTFRAFSYLVLAILIPTGFLSVVFYSLSSKAENSGHLKPGLLGSRVLVVAPHPDDECIAPGGLLQALIEKDTEVKVVIVTCGDASLCAAKEFLGKDAVGPADQRALGRERASESRKALEILGVDSRDVSFLGYPDGGINSLWSDNWDYQNPRRGTNGATESPYRFSYEKGAEYCGANLVRNLRSIIADFKPTAVVFPDSGDFHHDHWATNCFVQYVLAEMDYRCSRITYLVHRPDFLLGPADDFSAGLLVPGGPSSGEGRWLTFPLSERHHDRKLEAMRSYRVPAMRVPLFIKHFTGRNETFRQCEEPPAVRSLGESGPDLFGREFSCRVISESREPPVPVRPGLPGSFDIAEVGFAVGDRAAWVGIEVNGDIRGDELYAFHFRLFNSHGVSRLDFRARGVKGSAALVDTFSRNSVRPKGRLKIYPGSRRLWVELPGRLFHGYDRCLVGVGSFNGSARADKTSWRLLRL